MKYKKFCDVCTHDEGARGIITRTASACATCGYGTLDWIDGQFGTHTHTQIFDTVSSYSRRLTTNRTNSAHSSRPSRREIGSLRSSLSGALHRARSYSDNVRERFCVPTVITIVKPAIANSHALITRQTQLQF